jgi:hypothetical protein
MLVVAGIGCVGCGGGGGGGGRKGKHPEQKTVALIDRTWHCKSKVDLDLVEVTMHGSRQDAVHLDRGCTGTIHKLVVAGDGDKLGPGGDGVKVHAGVHDLQILSGEINCGRKFKRKHQDAIQAMGGKRVTFVGIVSHGCANSFMFISAGRQRHEIPDAIICRDCSATSRNYSVRVSQATNSGTIDGTYVSRLKPNAAPGAVKPVLENNQWRRRS